MIEFDEFLHTFDLFIHFWSDVEWFFFFPSPEADLLFGGSIGFTQSDDHVSIFIDIKGNNSVWVWVEDGFSWCACGNIPHNKHGIFSCVCRDDNI